MNDFKTTITSRKSKNSCGKSRNFNLESYEYIILLQIIVINNKIRSKYYRHIMKQCFLIFLLLHIYL